MRSQGIVNGPLSQRSLTGHVSRESHAIGQFSSALRGEPSSLEPSNYRRAKDANAKDTRSDNAVASLVRSSARTKDALCRYPTALPTRTRVTGAPARRNCRFTEQRAGHRPPLAGSRSAVGCITRRLEAISPRRRGGQDRRVEARRSNKRGCHIRLLEGIGVRRSGRWVTDCRSHPENS